MSIITLNTRSLPDSAVTTAKIAADAITDAKIADDVVGTEHLTAGEVDATALGADSVTAAKINNDIISGSTELASEPADTDEFLVSDAGTLKRIDYSLIKGGGITEADQWRVTSNFTDSADPISSNWERVDTDGYGKLGTGMTESSGVFSFASTGVYLINFTAAFTLNGSDRAIGIEIDTTTDGSSFDNAAANEAYINQTSGSVSYTMARSEFIFDVTNTSTHKCRFVISPVNSGTTTNGSTDQNRTYATFIRLGDT